MAILEFLPKIFRGVVIATLLLSAQNVRAQAGEPTATEKAHVLVDEASTLMDANNYADACPKLEEATLLVPDRIGAKMALGECYVGAGRLASAWEQYRRANIVASARHDERAKEAREQMQQLEPRIAHLTIVVPESIRGIPGLTITLDKVEQVPTSWGSAIKMDEGIHVLAAAAPQRKPWSIEMWIEPNMTSMTQVIPVMDTIQMETIQRPVNDSRVKRLPEVKREAPSTKPSFPRQSVAAFVFSSTGVVELGSGILVTGYGRTATKFTDFERGGYTGFGIALICVGAISLAGSIVLIAMDSTVKPTPNTRNAQIQWQFGVGPTGLGLHGSW